MKNVLFICTANKLRSKTAEAIFKNKDGYHVLSAGTHPTADRVVSIELIEWADSIFVMEKSHRNWLGKRFKDPLKGKFMRVLDIPDDYDFMDQELVSILERKLAVFFAENVQNATVTF